MKNYFCTVSIALAIGVLGACSSVPRHNAETVAQIPADSSPSEVIAQYEKEVSDAKANKLDWMAPTNYTKAENALVKAKNILKDQGKNADAFRAVQEGRAALIDAEKSATIAETSIPSAIKAREESLTARIEAEKSGAKDLKSTYEKADKHFIQLTAAIENDNLKWAENNQEESTRLYRVASADANKKRYLDSAKLMIESAKKEGAGSYAPSALKQAENAYEATEKFADNNPYATDQILKKGEETLAVAKRTLNLTRESQMFDRFEPEARVLWVEKTLNRIGQPLALNDLTTKTFDNQVVEIEKSLQSVNRVAMTAKGAQSENEALKGEMGELKGEVMDKESALARQVAFDSKIKEIQKQFDKDEAQVLREGNNVIIRVRSINFPVGKAQILPRDFALLSKLQKAIAEFDNSKVVVEGHTDSTGSAATNKKLSEERANTVREYLVANESIAPEEIRAVGKGFSEPLADNKTAAGRATNRRIDLVIEPSSTASAMEEGMTEPASAE